MLGVASNLRAQPSDTVHVNITDTIPKVVVTPTVPLEINKINITGNKKTKTYIILREVVFKEGEFIMPDELQKKMEQTRQLLMNTTLFVDVTVKIHETLLNAVTILIEVKERWYLFPLPYFKFVDRNFNQWWIEQKRSFNRVNYGLKFFQNNVSGRNDKLSLWVVNGYNKQISTRYEQPFADKSLKHGFSVGFSYSHQREMSYGTSENKQQFFKNEDKHVKQSLRAELAYSYRPDVRFRNYVRLAYINELVNDTILQLNPQYNGTKNTRIKFPELSYTLQYFNVDYIPYVTKGFMGEFTFSKRGLSKTMNMWSAQAKAMVGTPLFYKSYITAQAFGNIRLPFNQPYYNSTMLGYGDTQLRGLEYYVIDGVAGGMLRTSLIKELFTYVLRNPLRTKSHDKIPFRFLLKAFGDVGCVYNRMPGNNQLNNKLLRTWGVGLDIVSIYDFVFRIEYSFNQLNNDGLFLHTKNEF